MQGAFGPGGQLYQAFPLGGPVREVEVGTSWTDILAGSTVDLVMIRVPDETRRVLLFSTTDAIAGEPATGLQASQSLPLDPGYWTFSTNRDLKSGPLFYLAIDPRDQTPGVSETAIVTIAEGAR